jgi:predicted Rossmann fold flavoprotein
LSNEKIIAIVGGGAAGMCAALGAAEQRGSADVRIILLERNPRVGIKIRISGGGKCNVTHEGHVEDVLKEGFLIKPEQRFLKHAIYRFTNNDALAILDRHEVAWHARENGRIFPNSGRSEDVLQAFEAELREAKIEVITNARVTTVTKLDNGFETAYNDTTMQVDALIIATGGVSYQKVGTTGDGINFAEQLGHTIVKLRAALAPIYTDPTPPQELHGTAIRDSLLLIMRDGKQIAETPGDILITHRGLSGPATLDISRAAALEIEKGPIEVAANLLREDQENLQERLIALVQQRSQQQIKTWLEEVLPNRLAPFVLDRAQIPHDRKWNALRKDERQQLLNTLLRYPLGSVSEIPIDRGEVSAGGVSLSEVDSKTMMSRKHHGLFFCGEMLDIAGEIGGYNLQAAYSTGYVAGQEAVKLLLSNEV